MSTKIQITPFGSATPLIEKKESYDCKRSFAENTPWTFHTNNSLLDPVKAATPHLIPHI